MSGKGSLSFNVGLNGEKELRDALSRINAGIKVNEAEMKKITATYADNGQSMQALTAKGVTLQSQVDLQLKKVKSLAAAFQSANEKYGEGSKKTLEYQASLIKAETQLIEFEREQKANNKAIAEASKLLDENGNAIEETKGQTQSYGSAASSVFKALGLDIADTGIEVAQSFKEIIGGLQDSGSQAGSTSSLMASSLGGAPVMAAGALAAAIIEIGAEAQEAQNKIDFATDKIRVSLRLTADEAKKVTESVQDIYKKGLASDKEQAQEALTSVIRLMGLQGEEAESAANKIVAMGEDVTETARTASTIMNQFGISGEEALDVIAYGLTTTANKNGDLLDVLNEYSGSFERMGYTAEEFLTTIVSATDAGAYSADKAADAFKEFYNKASSGDTGMSDALKELHLNASTTIRALTGGGEQAQQTYERVVQKLAAVTDESKQAQIASALFGSQWEDVGTKAVLAMSNTQAQIIDVSGEAQRQYDILANSSATVGKQFDRTFEEVGNIAKTAVANAANPVKGLYDAIKRLAGELREFGSKGGVEAGAAMGVGIAEGIKNSQELINEAARNAVKGAESASKEAGEIHSPSKLFEREIGRQLAAGMGLGWDAGMEDVKKNINRSILEVSAIPSSPSLVTNNTATSNSAQYIFHSGSITIDAKNVKEFNDVVKAAQEERQRRRAR